MFHLSSLNKTNSMTIKLRVTAKFTCRNFTILSCTMNTQLKKMDTTNTSMEMFILTNYTSLSFTMST